VDYATRFSLFLFYCGRKAPYGRTNTQKIYHKYIGHCFIWFFKILEYTEAVFCCCGVKKTDNKAPRQTLFNPILSRAPGAWIRCNKASVSGRYGVRAGGYRLRPRTASTHACYCTSQRNAKKTRHCAGGKCKRHALSRPKISHRIDGWRFFFNL